MATKTPKIPFKAGDDFALTLTVTNKTSDPAIAAATAVLNAQTAYDAELAKTTPNPTTVATLLATLNAAKATYDAAIIVNITSWTITSSIRWITKLIADFTVTKTDAVNGKFTITCQDTITQLWKPRVYDVDVQFLIAGKKSSSQTFQIDVKQDITEEVVV